jgi:hypothetical protein
VKLWLWEKYLGVVLPPWRAGTAAAALYTATLLYGPGWWRDAR